MKMDGVGFKAAVAITGDSDKLSPNYRSRASSRVLKMLEPPSRGGDFIAREYAACSDIWSEHAAKLVSWAMPRLAGSQGMAVLEQKGITPGTASECRLGWIPQDVYRDRESWGLDTRISDKTGQPKRLWIPCGIVIPDIAPLISGASSTDVEISADGGQVRRIRVRRPEGDPRYYVVPGSSLATMYLGGITRSVVVVESELDAILIWQEAGEITSVMALGSAATRPDFVASQKLSAADRILVALDNDDAGEKSSAWWLKTFRHARRLKMTSGKDPSDMWRSGADIRQWVISGWPEAWRILANNQKRCVVGKNAASEASTPSTESALSTPPTNLSELAVADSGPIESLLDILRRNSQIKIVINDRNMRLLVPDDWKSRHPSLFGQLSRLVFFDPEVFDYLHHHGSNMISAGNLMKNIGVVRRG
jgi:hypothetical protein